MDSQDGFHNWIGASFLCFEKSGSLNLNLLSQKPSKHYPLWLQSSSP